MSFEQALKNRRTMYALSAQSTISDERVEDILATCLRHSPTAFNSQSPRAVLLLGPHHQKLWDIVMETLRKIVPAENFDRTETKINGFAAAYGTILYFEDRSVTKQLADEYPEQKDTFPIWAMQQNGMLMCNVWTMLESEGLGASLQHYNPLIDEEVKAQWGIPDCWQLLAQMPFGTPTAPPEEKEFDPIHSRYKVFSHPL